MVAGRPLFFATPAPVVLPAVFFAFFAGDVIVLLGPAAPGFLAEAVAFFGLGAVVFGEGADFLGGAAVFSGVGVAAAAAFLEEAVVVAPAGFFGLAAGALFFAFADAALFLGGFVAVAFFGSSVLTFAPFLGTTFFALPLPPAALLAAFLAVISPPLPAAFPGPAFRPLFLATSFPVPSTLASHAFTSSGALSAMTAWSSSHTPFQPFHLTRRVSPSWPTMSEISHCCSSLMVTALSGPVSPAHSILDLAGRPDGFAEASGLAGPAGAGLGDLGALDLGDFGDFGDFGALLLLAGAGVLVRDLGLPFAFLIAPAGVF